MDNLDRLEPPCKVEETISLSFQFENLQKYLTYITKTNSQFVQKMKDFQVRISEFEEIKTRFDELELKMDSFGKKFDDVEHSLGAHQNKIMESESKIWSITEKVEDQEGKVKSITEKSLTVDENLNNLNRLTEESIKNIHKINETVERVKFQQDSLGDKSEGMEKRITKLFDDITEREKKLKEIETRIEVTTEKKINEAKDLLRENVDRLQKKISDNENTIVKVVDTVTELSNGGSVNARRKSSVHLGGNNNNTNGGSNSTTNINSNTLSSLQNEAVNNLIMSELTKTTKDVEELKQDKKTLTDNIDLLQRNLEDLKDQIKNVNNRIESVNKEISEERINSSMLLSNYDGNQTKREKEEQQLQTIQYLNVNTEAINDNIQKLSENIKIVSQNLGHKATREDVDKLNKTLKAEIERVSDKFNETSKLLEMKMKTMATSNHRGSVDLYDSNFGASLQESIAKVSKEIIEKEISSYDLSKNENFKEAQFKIEYNKSEIDKVFESIIEIRKTFVDTSQPLEETVKEANSRILDIELNMRRVKMQLDDVVRNLEGENQGEEEQKEVSKKESEVSNNSGSLREYIRNLASTQKILIDKVDKIHQKQENMNAEILAKVKKDLQYESNRILEDFKGDLKTSINKIEDQLREKVDRFNLDEFGKKIDSKFNFEINKKLDRNDLKKNNNLINRKIDTLENKISKTLVDTLIDLQMEEAPLIVKKSMGGEKCASCNQFLPHSHHEGGMYEHNTHTHKNLYKTTGKFHTSNYRPGEGNKISSGGNINSIHSPINELPEEERERGGSKKHFQLPDINLNKSNPDLAGGVGKKKSNNARNSNTANNINNNMNENDVKNLNALINEDLEKKYLGPNDLIKTANKAYDNKK